MSLLLFWSDAGAGTITGTFDVTIDAVALAADAELIIQGSLAKTIDAVQDAFATGWKATDDVTLRAELKSEYESVKLALATPPKNLGEHLDRLQTANGGVQ